MIENFETVVLLVTTIGVAALAVYKSYKAAGLKAALVEASKHSDEVLAAVNKFMSNTEKATSKEVKMAKEVLKKDTYCMSDDVRKFLLSGLSEADKALANKTIDDHEERGIYNYTIRLSNRSYTIKLGQIAGSAVW